jgi:hypothetical protein
VQHSQPLNDTINLRICCDVPASPDAASIATSTFVRNFTWHRGSFTFVVHTKPQGLTAQWIDCWEPKSKKEAAIILEDDIEVSPFAFKWLDDARVSHADDDDVIGLSLQRQTNCFHTECEQRQTQIPWSVREYKYVLVGTWGYSPLAKHWIAFQNWYRKVSSDSNYVPNVPNIIPSGWYKSFKAIGRENTMWEMWFIEYCHQNRLYTIYYNHPTPLTLGAHWAERGEHFDGNSPHRDFELVSYDFMPIQRSFPTLPAMWWDGKLSPTDSIEHQIHGIVAAMRHHSRRGRFGLITFINYSYRNMTLHFLCNLRSVAPELLETMIIVTTDAPIFNAMISARRPNEQYAVMPLTISTSTAEEHLKFGTRHYYDMILLRTQVLQKIIQDGSQFMLFECDAFVKENFVVSFAEAARKSKADIVAIQDNRGGGPEPNCGFLLFTNRSAVEPFWSEIERTFSSSLHGFRDRAANENVGVINDQLVFRDLLSRNSHQMRVHIMDTNHYFSGQELHFGSITGHHVNASVVLFNWVVGNKAKRDRAFSRKMWFFDETKDTCTNPLS